MTISQLTKQLDLCDKLIAQLGQQITRLDVEILALRGGLKILK